MVQSSIFKVLASMSRIGVRRTGRQHLYLAAEVSLASGNEYGVVPPSDCLAKA